jgi:hypothetical protein
MAVAAPWRTLATIYHATECEAAKMIMDPNSSTSPDRYGPWRVPEISIMYPKIGQNASAETATDIRRTLFQNSPIKRKTY